jgi:hypothetical protein
VSLIHLQDDALPIALFRRLRGGVRGLGDEHLRSTYQKTFWFEFGQASSFVEEAVASLRPLLPDVPLVGVEWWLSRMTTNRIRVDFHKDRDEKRSLRGGSLRHPRFSSVLFLNRVKGGALAVTAQPPVPENPCSVPMPLDADLAAPRANRLVWFDGNLTHGVLDASNQVPGSSHRSQGELRLSIVMNWWRRPPMDVPSFAGSGIYAALRALPKSPVLPQPPPSRIRSHRQG